MTVSIQFLGAAGTVTGSKYIVRSRTHQILVDAGMFQGERSWREKNWEELSFDPKAIDAVLLTHAHVDHIGILPRFFAKGLNAPVYCTAATADLSKLLLMDAAKLQEEEAGYRSRHGRSRHSPVLPLYTTQDARDCLEQFRTVPFSELQEIFPSVSARWERMGHILGAASISLEISGRKITFSGDIGRYHVPILKDPVPVPLDDLLLIESTYGNRTHIQEDPKIILGDIISRTAARKGVVVIPSFAVGRTQLLLYYIRELKEEGKIPNIPIIVDSPMARDATALYADHPADYDEEALGILKLGHQPFHPKKLGFISSTEESKRLNSIVEPMIIISASGMLSGGRILHHLKHRISSPLNTILFVGFQPNGSRGAWIKSGAETLTLLGEEAVIRAEIAEISSLSAHADKNELLRWCGESAALSQSKPGTVCVVHGEPDSATAFADNLRSKFSWNVKVPKFLDQIEV